MSLPSLGALGLGPPTGPMVTYTAPPEHTRETRRAKRAKGQRNDQCAISFDEFRDGEEVWKSPNSDHLYKPQQIYQQIHTNGYVDPMTRDPIPYDEATCLYNWLRAHGFNVAPPPDPPPPAPPPAPQDSADSMDELQGLFAASRLPEDPWDLFDGIPDSASQDAVLSTTRTPAFPRRGANGLFVPKLNDPSDYVPNGEQMISMERDRIGHPFIPEMGMSLTIQWSNSVAWEHAAIPPGEGGALVLSLKPSDYIEGRPNAWTIDNRQKLHLCMALVVSQGAVHPLGHHGVVDRYRWAIAEMFGAMSQYPSPVPERQWEGLEQELRGVLTEPFSAVQTIGEALRAEVVGASLTQEPFVRFRLYNPRAFELMSPNAMTYLDIRGSGASVDPELRICLRPDEFASFVQRDAEQRPGGRVPAELAQALEAPLHDFFLPGTHSDQLSPWQRRSTHVTNMMGLIDVVAWHTWTPIQTLLTAFSFRDVPSSVERRFGEGERDDDSEQIIHDESNGARLELVAFRTEAVGDPEVFLHDYVNARWISMHPTTYRFRRTASNTYQWIMPELVGGSHAVFGVNIEMLFR